MPTCQQIMSVTVSGPFTSGPISSPSSTSSHQRVFAPRGASRAYCSSIAASVVLRVRRLLERAPPSCAPAPSCARCGPCSGTDRTAAGRRRCGTPGRSTRGLPARRTPTACRARRPGRSAATYACSAAAAPTTPGRSRRRTRGRRAAGHPSSGRGARRATSATSSSPISVSPPTIGGGAIGAPHRVVAPYVGIAAERVVVAVGLRDVTERVGVGAQVVRRARVGLGHADAGAQPLDALVGDLAGGAHGADGTRGPSLNAGSVRVERQLRRPGRSRQEGGRDTAGAGRGAATSGRCAVPAGAATTCAPRAGRSASPRWR